MCASFGGGFNRNQQSFVGSIISIAHLSRQALQMMCIYVD